MPLLRILGLMLAWLFTPTNLLATSVTTAVAYSWGYVEGHHASSKTVPGRVERAVKRVFADKKLAEDLLTSAAGTAADAVKPPPLVTAGPRGRDALLSLCHSDPTCRRDGS
jgi:hypothetical protein